MATVEQKRKCHSLDGALWLQNMFSKRLNSLPFQCLYVYTFLTAAALQGFKSNVKAASDLGWHVVKLLFAMHPRPQSTSLRLAQRPTEKTFYEQLFVKRTIVDRDHTVHRGSTIWPMFVCLYFSYCSSIARIQDGVEVLTYLKCNWNLKHHLRCN